jgi:flagellar hook-associated protein 2
MAVDYIKSLNAGSGLNTTEIIDALITAERQPAADQITSAREEKTVSISSLGKLKQTLSTSQTGITAIEGTTGLTQENSGTAIGMTITDTSIARSFTNAVEVNQLAKAQTLVFSGFTSPTETVGTGSLGFSFGTWTNNSFFRQFGPYHQNHHPFSRGRQPDQPEGCDQRGRDGCHGIDRQDHRHQLFAHDQKP